MRRRKERESSAYCGEERKERVLLIEVKKGKGEFCLLRRRKERENSAY